MESAKLRKVQPEAQSSLRALSFLGRSLPSLLAEPAKAFKEHCGQKISTRGTVT